MVTGILFTIAACFCWGLVFVVPSFLENFHPFEIALGRFFIYGLISLVFILIKKRDLFSKKHLNHWKKASYFSLFSTLVCYTGTVFNMQYAGPTIATLVFAMVPITIALAGNWHKKEYPSQKLFIPLSLMVVGIFLAKFKGIDDPTTPFLNYFIGLFFGLLGLASWTWFAVANSHFLKQNKDLSVNNWGLMLGTSTFFHVLVFGAIFLFSSENHEKFHTFSVENQTFAVASVILGTLSTWLAFFLWNQGSKRLPISMTGQLMISEIIFALLLIYIFEKSVPTIAELSGILFMISGVFLGFKKLNNYAKAASN